MAAIILGAEVEGCESLHSVVSKHTITYSPIFLSSNMPSVSQSRDSLFHHFWRINHWTSFEVGEGQSSIS